MTDNDGVKKISDTASQAEEKAVETMENIETSKLGKKLPTEIHDVKLTDIIKFVLLSSTANFLPCLLIYGKTFTYRAVEWPRRILFFCYILCTVAVFMFTLVGYMSNTTSFFKYCLFSSIGKASFSLVLMFMAFVSESLFKIIISMIYYLYTDVTDFFLLYYLALYFKRVESDEYDYEGNLIKKETPAK